MARIIGVEVPPNKRIDIALRYIYGIGPSNALDILEKAKIERHIRASVRLLTRRRRRPATPRRWPSTPQSSFERRRPATGHGRQAHCGPQDRQYYPISIQLPRMWRRLYHHYPRAARPGQLG